MIIIEEGSHSALPRGLSLSCFYVVTLLLSAFATRIAAPLTLAKGSLSDTVLKQGYKETHSKSVIDRISRFNADRKQKYPAVESEVLSSTFEAGTSRHDARVTPQNDDEPLINIIMEGVKLIKALDHEEFKTWEDGRSLSQSLEDINNIQKDLTARYGGYSMEVNAEIKALLLQRTLALEETLSRVSPQKWSLDNYNSPRHLRVTHLEQIVQDVIEHAKMLGKELSEFLSQPSLVSQGRDSELPIHYTVKSPADVINSERDVEAGLLSEEKKIIDSWTKQAKLNKNVDYQYVLSKLQRIQTKYADSQLMKRPRSEHTVQDYRKFREIIALRKDIIIHIAVQNQHIVKQSNKSLQHLEFAQAQWNFNLFVLKVERMFRYNERYATEALTYAESVDWAKLRRQVGHFELDRESSKKLLWVNGRIIHTTRVQDPNKWIKPPRMPTLKLKKDS